MDRLSVLLSMVTGLVAFSVRRPQTVAVWIASFALCGVSADLLAVRGSRSAGGNGSARSPNR